MFLPPYSPELNLIEGGGQLKSSIINNVFLRAYIVKNAIGNFIDNINKVPTQIIDRPCVVLNVETTARKER